MTSSDGRASRRRPGSCPVVVAGGSGHHLGSAPTVDRAHDWAHGLVQVGSGRLWVVDLSQLPAGALTVGQVSATGCWDVSLSVLEGDPTERCGPRRPAYVQGLRSRVGGAL
jgi:hypothetical protein